MGNQHPLNEKSGGVRNATIRKLAKDGTTWTPTEQRTRDKCLRQFCAAGRKGVEVTSGNSDAFKRGWTLMFGTPEEKALALAEMEAKIAEAEQKALKTPMPSPCECGNWLHQAWCPTGRASLDRYGGIDP